MMETRWWLIRHAPVTDPAGVILGQLDVGADLRNRTALAMFARCLPAEGVRLSSPLKRCRETAVVLAPPGAVVGEEADFREQHFGDWQGLSHGAVAERWPEAAARFWQSPMTAAPPGGEAFAAMASRAAEALGRLSVIHHGRDVVAVVHDGTIRAALLAALGGVPEMVQAFKIDNLSLTRLDYLFLDNGQAAWRVVGVNWRAEPLSVTASPVTAS